MFGGFGQQPSSSTTSSSAGLLFGANTGNTTNTTPFGTTGSTATPGTGLFGATSTQPASTSLFGSTAAPAASTGLFGAATTTTAPSTGLFGATPAPSTGAFGSTAPATGASTGLFGATNTSSTGLFGSTAQPAQSTFGATTQAPSTGLFGAAPAASTSLFGSKPATTGFGGFGQATQQPTSTGLFGQATQQQPTSTGLFGQSTQPAQAMSLFGQSMAPAQPQIADYLMTMKEYWNPNSPYCQFRHYFYNIVHPSEVHMYTKPPNQDEALWNQAMQDNPDPTCMVPVLAVGFDDIKKRMDEQNKACKQHLYKLEEAKQKLETIKRKHHLDTLIKLEEFKRRHVEYCHRVLKLIRVAHILHKKSYPITPQEESQLNRLTQLSMVLNKPSMFRGKVNELGALLELIKEGKASADGKSVSVGRGGWAVADPEGLKNVYAALSDIQSGLSHLNQILKTDGKDLDIMLKGYGDAAGRR